MKTDSESTLAEDWLVAASSDKLSAKRSLHTKVLGKEVILTRDASGRPCANVRNGPRDQDISPIFVCERYRMIWIAFQKPMKPLFDIAEFGQAGRRIIPCGSIGVNTSGLRVVENFLDMAHLPYVHSGWLGKEPHSEVKEYRVTLNPDVDELWATNCRFWQPKAAPSAADGFEVEYTYRVMQPFVTMLYKSSPARPGYFDFVLLCVQPQTEEQCLVHSLLGYFDDVSSDAELISFMQLIFGQDKPILESQLPKRMPLDPRTEVPTRADAMSIAYRRWLHDKGVTYGVHR
ncbi:putative methylxanthine N7-demethylase NdmC [Paraburkholderia domus]|jgi:Phenylpropionate dioxygenase and related ring-hydroxylating dioxygenases, large terminal subunit|uniref:Methylxanthine N7-demethylase NdmC n=1 Tax=Paraburkholderia domus TaxID=2793075 RepID=A0A9N8QSL2_9BURK|nr:aromatic ring-hydroxylating dioxygenase subunit alpha [Paraburkholderia domus]MBK5053619.1 aromatic ring-hydroxylating dioxygenase subunit alpha [Burkholderia sp. R-70006]MBK5064902.1 aromatic ring-hydroxylating dioxygenase subunit alpha [Burkholderia sp. R-70199]MBK5090889.1 aromatic ring-hydroxylating dioxygenase subunit alpha [Burkholderia sp. R-69927]MBK5125024.1 aromatic ring-hydroxylating dioxygenase subunit alpha [Burkholderia sp. R-69980]MBK5168530.1 aromatic ring-hydroxylating diox